MVRPDNNVKMPQRFLQSHSPACTKMELVLPHERRGGVELHSYGRLGQERKRREGEEEEGEEGWGGNDGGNEALWKG